MAAGIRLDGLPFQTAPHGARDVQDLDMQELNDAMSANDMASDSKGV